MTYAVCSIFQLRKEDPKVSSTYVIHPVVCGLNATDQGIMTYQRHYGTRIHIPIYMFYLEGERKILVDTGLEDFMVDPAVEESLGFKAEGFDDGLERLGVKPEEIEIIVHTHLHNDHCENDAACTNAKVYVQKRELDFCHDPHPLDHRYDADYLEDSDIVTLEGDSEIVPGVRVVLTPGHTPGGQSVVIDTRDSGKVLLTGFCCNEKNFPDSGPAVCPGVHTDALVAWDSIQRVKQLKDSGEIDRIVPCHAHWPALEGRIG